MKLPVDHLIFGVPELNSGMDLVEALLGVRPIFGGQHPGKGTHNALLRLGENAYLEVIAPDPSQAGTPWFPVSPEMRPRLITWAARSENLTTEIAQAKRGGIPLGNLLNGQRSTPAGDQLSWEMTAPTFEIGEGIVPFFINWNGSTTHLQNLPSGCTMMSLNARSRRPEHVRARLKAFNLHLNVEWGSTPQLIAEIECPRGHVMLS